MKVDLPIENLVLNKIKLADNKRRKEATTEEKSLTIAIEPNYQMDGLNINPANRATSLINKSKDKLV